MTQHLYDAGPMSMTLAQHHINVGSVCGANREEPLLGRVHSRHH